MFLRKFGLNIHVYSNRWFCNSCSKGLKSAYQEFNERHFEHMEILHDKSYHEYNRFVDPLLRPLENT